MAVLWSARAHNDLRGIWRYLLERNLDAAEATHRRIITSAGSLADHPRLGRAGRSPGTRELVVPGSPYIVVYRIVGEDVSIDHVWDGRRNGPIRTG